MHMPGRVIRGRHLVRQNENRIPNYGPGLASFQSRPRFWPPSNFLGAHMGDRSINLRTHTSIKERPHPSNTRHGRPELSAHEHRPPGGLGAGPPRARRARRAHGRRLAVPPRRPLGLRVDWRRVDGASGDGLQRIECVPEAKEGSSTRAIFG